MAKRVIIVVLDSLGIGALPDAREFGDEGSNTLLGISRSPKFRIPNLLQAGLGRIDGIDFLPKENSPLAAFGRMAEKSKGKDTTVGHWELAGVISSAPLPTYPNGFPAYVLNAFEKQTGRGVLCNRPYSGTEVIARYGREHLETGKLIVYTSADSVFQIAAHESVVPCDLLYEYCRTAREILTGEHGVGRVIARPFAGKEGAFYRTENRKDFSLPAPKRTLPDTVKEAGLDSIFLGKTVDIFSGRGMTEGVKTKGNSNGMDWISHYLDRDFHGLLFANLVDFDSHYGHRNDVDGYASALSEFDARLPSLLEKLNREDVLILTADHGCDPSTPSTDHSREYVPILMFGENIKKVNLGTRSGFSDLACTVSALLGIPNGFPGESFYDLVWSKV